MAEIAGTRVINKTKSEQKINLRTILGRKPSTEEKERFVIAAIEHINNRTLSGEDVEGSKFHPYSEEYADKKGVTRTSVDLFLKGKMLDSIEPGSSTRDTVAFKIDDSEEAKKSYNHNVGDTLPKREFFGITKSEAESIARDIKGRTEAPQEETFTLAGLRDALALLGIEQEE